MLSFTQFILESGDSHHPFEKLDSNKNGVHIYKFKDDSGSTKHVDFDHRGYKDSADLDFHDAHNNRETGDVKYGASGDLGHKAAKVFATVHHIIKHHAKDYDELRHINFDSRGNEPSRVKLYSRMTKRLGGVTVINHEGGGHHQIPVNED